MFPFLRLEDEDLSGRTIIIRMDFNCPPDLDTVPQGLRDTKRIDDHIDTTIIPLFNRSTNVPKNMVILAHQGRKGHKDFTTLRAHFEHCRAKLMLHEIKTLYKWDELTDAEVAELGDAAVASSEVLDRINTLRERTVLLLENVRFSKSEEKGKSREDFARDPLIEMLGAVPNKVVALDGFSVAHRAQASVVGLANLGPLYAGPVVVREIEQLSKAVAHPELPMLLAVGGAKIDDSIEGIEQFLSRHGGTQVITGGLVGLAFLHSQGVPLNSPTVRNIERACGEKFNPTIRKAKALLEKHGTERIKLPVDVAFAPAGGMLETRQTVSLKHAPNALQEIGDIGIETIATYNFEIAKSRTVVMNGPMGRYESRPLSLGTEEILRYSALVAGDRQANVLIGGGDTGAALSALPATYVHHIKQCSSGKAFLEVVASGSVENLAGVRVLARAA